MDRNTMSHFSDIPSVDIKRSAFKRPMSHKTTFSAGELIPIYLEEVLPGDSVTLDIAELVRMNTPVFPVMDNAFIDTYFFYTPTRILWDHWREFNGENRLTFWEQTTEYEVPQITAPAGGWEKGTIADYFGLPTKVENISVSALPFRAYSMIYNEWFRNQNTNQPCMMNTDDATIAGSNGNNYITDAQKGGKPVPVARFADYFSSALPQPQKGESILMPLGNYAPVIALENDVITSGTTPVHVKKLGTTGEIATDANVTTHKDSSTGKSVLGYTGTASGTYHGGIVPVNLAADLKNITGGTINELRQAFAIQRQYEKDARFGTRYREIVKQFGVTSPDSRMQVPEYLGGKRTPVNVEAIYQSSATNETSPQGNAAAFSVTFDNESLFTKSFTEHGFIMGLVCVRTDRTYQQGIRRMWSRKKRFDYYWPSFANLSEMAILNKELYATGTAADEEAFGYQEAWADYRYGVNYVSGAMRSNYDQSLDAWHYADYYTEQPILSSGWMNEGKANIDRTIAVTSELEDQFNADFYIDSKWVRPMPVYSVPGLIDHN